jgi:hypothetical protein
MQTANEISALLHSPESRPDVGIPGDWPTCGGRDVNMPANGSSRGSACTGLEDVSARVDLVSLAVVDLLDSFGRSPGAAVS